jgi:hypothetical protein
LLTENAALNSVVSTRISSSKGQAIGRSIVLAVTILLSLYLQFGIAWQYRRSINEGSPDFRNLYTAGKIVDSGRADQLYNRDLQEQVQKSIFGGSVKGEFNFLPYIHPPFEAIVYALLALMPYVAAFWTVWVCNVLLAYVSLLILRSQVPNLHKGFGLVIIAMSIFKPLLTTEMQGQDSIVILLLFIACFVSVARERYALAGVAIGLACCKPQQALLLLFLILIFIPRARWRILVACGLTCLSMIAVSAATIGVKATLGFPRAVRVFAALYDDTKDRSRVMPNIRGLMFSLLEARVSHHSILLIIQIISGLVLVLTIMVLSRKTRSDMGLRFALAVTTVVLVAFYGYAHDFTPLLLPLILVWNFLAGTGVKTWNQRLLAASVLILICGGVLSILPPPVIACTTIFFFALLCMEIFTLDSKGAFETPSEALA